MKLKELYEMSYQDLRYAEQIIDRLFHDLGIDVEWSTHFVDRLEGREQDVTREELVLAFKKLREKYSRRLLSAKDRQREFVAVLKDMASDLNIPFSIDYNKVNPENNKYVMRGITIMRKNPRDFKTSHSGSPELKVQER